MAGDISQSLLVAPTGQTYASDIEFDSLGNKYIAGEYVGSSSIDLAPSVSYADNRDVLFGDGFVMGGYVAKYDANGDFLWARSINFGGSAGNLQLTSIGDEGVFVAGTFSGSLIQIGNAQLTSNGGGEDIFLSRLDANGDFIHTTQLTNRVGNDLFKDFEYRASSSSLYLTSVEVGTSNVSRVKRYSVSAGGITEAWTKSLAATRSATVQALALTSNEQVVLAGSFAGTADFEPSAATYNLSSGPKGNDSAQSGFVWTLNANGSFSSAVNFVNQKSGKSTGYNNITSLAVTSSNEIVVSGTFARSVDFNPGSGTTVLADAGNGDAFVVKLNASRTLSWAKGFGTSASDRASGIAVDRITGDIFVGTLTSSNATTQLLKLNSAGAVLWTTQFTGDSSSPLVFALDPTGDLHVGLEFYGALYYTDLAGYVTTFTSNPSGESALFLKIRK